MTKTIIPRTQHIIVERIIPDKTAGGIHIPDTAQKKEDSKWIAIAVGPDVKDIQPGDELLFDARCCVKIELAGVPENFHIVLAENIIGVIT